GTMTRKPMCSWRMSSAADCTSSCGLAVMTLRLHMLPTFMIGSPECVVVLAARSVLAVLFTVDDLGERGCFGGEALQEVIEAENAHERGALVHHRDAAYTVELHSFEGLRDILRHARHHDWCAHDLPQGHPGRIELLAEHLDHDVAVSHHPDG